MTNAIVEKTVSDLSVGQSVSLSKTVSESDIIAFADVTGDNNPVHLDADYAATTPFKSRIAHGMLSAGYISAVIGTKLPGPGAIYMSQSLKFKAPVRIGDQVDTTCTITAIDLVKRRVSLSTECRVGDVVVVEGEALVMVPAAKS
jgi:3-hydroxybutyryl-CoA dehydratase